MSYAGRKAMADFVKRRKRPRFAPPGKTVVQIDSETEWDYWNELRRYDVERYRHGKARIAGELLVGLEKHCYGISAAVEITDVAIQLICREEYCFKAGSVYYKNLMVNP